MPLSCIKLIRNILFLKLLFRTRMKSAMFIVLNNGGILGCYRVIQLYELHSIKPKGGFYMHVVFNSAYQVLTKFVQKVGFSLS